MSTLALLQQQFIDHLHGRPGHFVDCLADSSGLARADRADIYFNAYRVRLLDTLKDSFDKTWAWLGDARFEAAALGYVAAHPPTQFSLRPFGDRYADWLHATCPEAPEVAELARLDWAMRNAFDGPDATPLSGDMLAGFSDEDWSRVVFVLHPTAQLLQAGCNTLDLWHAMDRNEAPPAVHTLPQPLAVLVWRKELQPHFRSLDDAEAAMLSAMQRATPFAQACEAIASDDAPALVGSWIARWLEDGVVCLGGE